MKPAIKRLSEQCVSYEYDGLSNREYSILFQSDQHFDSVDCNRDLFSEKIEINCFGKLSLDRGQSLEPIPPQRITGII